MLLLIERFAATHREEFLVPRLTCVRRPIAECKAGAVAEFAEIQGFPRQDTLSVSGMKLLHGMVCGA